MLPPIHSTIAELSRQDAKQRLSEYGANSLTPQKYKSIALMLLLNQFKSPIILILIFAADATIVLTSVIISGLLFGQEWGASIAFKKLLALVQLKATLLKGKMLPDRLLFYSSK